jgi:2-succinyl-5-enolpyruvyl-6-hydroxy-3-cyclohexene-1-carboxylate synthase
MDKYYTDERNAQIVISLLKSHGIKKVVASPGTTNICFVASMQNDPFFEIYSAPEERSAAYIACGLAEESGEPVVITCTGATASRNYYPGLTEAYYRKLPILAVTCSRRSYRIGHNIDQVTDRTKLPNDVAKISVQVPLVYDNESEWNDVIMVNKAILELNHHGKGPVHINLETNYSLNYGVRDLPEIRAIYRVNNFKIKPQIKADRVAIFVGSHSKFDYELTEYIEKFCEQYNGIVLCDHTSNYKGKYRVFGNLLGQQRNCKTFLKNNFELVIHIGNVHAPAYNIKTNEVWRINPDGELRDTFGKLKYVFEMEEVEFFKEYTMSAHPVNIEFYKKCDSEIKEINYMLQPKINELPFCNAWIASQTAGKLPVNSVLHLGIQNSLRFWNMFDTQYQVLGYCNTGGFGIDGSVSSVIGASLHNRNKLYYCVLGDLAFFYDLNSLGNRHIGNNIRIIMINNGKGTEFKLSGNPGSMFGDKCDEFIAAAGHYGNKSSKLVKEYAENLGFEYFGVSNKQEYLNVIDKITSPIIDKGPMIVEAFINSDDDKLALDFIANCKVEDNYNKSVKNDVKKTVKNIIGSNNYNTLKKIIKKD